MTGVIIAASERDKKMWGVLPGILRQNLDNVYLGAAPRLARRDDQAIVVCGGEDAVRLEPDVAVVICKDADCPGMDAVDGNAVAVVDTCNGPLLERVSATGLPAITCGLSARDTLTLPSFHEDSAVLGIQRSIACFDGTTAEPQEIPLRLSRPIDSFTLMAAASVFILSGHITELKNIVF